MGLDSVMLVIEFENYFGISFTEEEAQRIYSVEDAVNVITAMKNVSEMDSVITPEVLKMFNHELWNLNLKNVEMNDFIFDVLDPDKIEVWKEISSRMEICCTMPNKKAKKESLFSTLEYYDWETITTKQFIQVQIAANLNRYLNREKINSREDIYMALIYLTHEVIGVDPYFITPDKRFTDDFGID